MTATTEIKMGVSPRHLLGLDGMGREEILALLDDAARMSEAASTDRPPLDTLKNKIIANIFFENSTRTRCSFTIAARRLGADNLDITGSSSSYTKGETLLDTCYTLRAMGVHAFVIRTAAAGAPHQVAKQLGKPVINAGDGRHEHPTQGLLDLLTLRDRIGELENKEIAIVGDIVNSRVARSALFGLTALGADVHLVGPPSLVSDTFKEITNGEGRVSIHNDFDAIIPEMDAVMMLRVQFERDAGEAIASVDEYRQRFSMTRDRADRLKDHAIVLHPGPVNRGLEIESSVADDPARSVILNQVKNGVAVRMAVLTRALE